MAVQPQAQPQEIVINDFSAGIFTHREFASAQSAQDGAGAEFINATDQPVPLTDYSPQPFTFPPTPVDLSARLYAYGCSGSISGLQPLPRLVASFIDQGENFDGSEIVLIDLDRERLDLVKVLADKMARAKGIDLTVTVATAVTAPAATVTVAVRAPKAWQC